MKIKCQHEWLPETQYRLRRCKHCGGHPFEDALARLRRRAHVHVGDGSGREQPSGSCYGFYEPCGEHHAHDELCGGRRLVCGRAEDRDAIAIVERIEASLGRSGEHLDDKVIAIQALEQIARGHFEPISKQVAQRALDSLRAAWVKRNEGR